MDDGWIKYEPTQHEEIEREGVSVASQLVGHFSRKRN